MPCRDDHAHTTATEEAFDTVFIGKNVANSNVIACVQDPPRHSARIVKYSAADQNTTSTLQVKDSCDRFCYANSTSHETDGSDEVESFWVWRGERQLRCRMQRLKQGSAGELGDEDIGTRGRERFISDGQGAIDE